MCISRSCGVRFVCRSAHIAAQRHLVIVALLTQVRIQRGGQGNRTAPGKSQVIWVSIGDPPGKSWTPLENVGPPLEP